MGLIYKPNALYMEPKNTSVDITSGVDFSFVFKGYQMYKATGQLYQNSNIGEWVAVGNPFEFAPSSNAPYYNNQNITCHINTSDSIYSVLSGNVNSTLGWGVSVYSMPSTQTAANDNSNTMIPALRGFAAGDTVDVYSGSGTTTPYEYTYISNYSSKLSLGNVNSGEDIEGTDLTNTFTVPEATFINLTSGDEIKENISATPYYLYKINEGASEPVAYYIRFYATKAEAEAGSGTVVSGATLQNKTYYVNPVTNTSSTFYVGLTGGNIIKLYVTKEASLQGVADAVIPLTNGATYTIQAVEKSQVIQFTPILVNVPFIDIDDLYPVDEHITLTIDPVNDTTYEYSSDDIVLYTGQKIISDTDMVYYVYVWDADNNIISLYTTRQGAFEHDNVYLTAFDTDASYAYLSEVLVPNQEFVVSWSSANVPLIMNWKAQLYNVNVDDNNNIISRNLIEDSGMQYNANIKYTFSHLLLSALSNIGEAYDNSLGRYEVVFDLTDDTGYDYLCSQSFDVGYSVSDIVYSPIVTVDNCDSSVLVDWSNALSIQGEYTGSAPTIIDDYLYDGNHGAVIAANNTLSFETNIPPANFPAFLFKPSANFNGVIFALEGDTQDAELSYNSSLRIFIFSVTDKKLSSTISTIVSTDVSVLDSSRVYLIGYADGEVYIRDFGAA